MTPRLRDGDIIVGWRTPVRVGDIVVAEYDGREIVKRVTNIQDDTYFLEGDNKSASTDSRSFGFLPEQSILGVMKLHFATATPPTPLKKKQTMYAAWIMAAVFAAFAVLHLFRIDTFVPLLDQIFPGGRTAAGWIAVGIVSMEVFALPFLMRMSLSPLARTMGAIFTILVPLFWLLVSIWTYGTTLSTAQLGEFRELTSSWLLIILNVAWLAYAYALVSVLQPSWLKELRKR